MLLDLSSLFHTKIKQHLSIHCVCKDIEVTKFILCLKIEYTIKDIN